MKIDGELLNNIRFADDVFVCTSTHKNYNILLGHIICYKNYPMKGGKCVTPPDVNNVLIESGEGYIYWAQQYNLKEKYHDEESWKARRHTSNTGISSKTTLIASS